MAVVRYCALTGSRHTRVLGHFCAVLVREREIFIVLLYSDALLTQRGNHSMKQVVFHIGPFSNRRLWVVFFTSGLISDTYV